MIKRFWFEATIEDGMLKFKSEGEGFGIFELLGIWDWKREDILAQIRGDVKPDKVERKAIVNSEAEK
jgi:hypothetical protein